MKRKMRSCFLKHTGMGSRNHQLQTGDSGGNEKYEFEDLQGETPTVVKINDHYPGVTEDIIQNASKTEDGKKTLPTVLK